MININEITTNFPIHSRLQEATIIADCVFPKDRFIIRSVLCIDSYKDNQPVALIIAIDTTTGQWHLVTVPNFDLKQKTVGVYKSEDIAKHIAQNWIAQYQGL